MKNYEITFRRSARKELEVIEDSLVENIFSKIDQLVTNPRPKGTKKIKGRNNLWRIRVGEYRVIYSIDDKSGLVDIVFIRHRKDVYR